MRIQTTKVEMDTQRVKIGMIRTWKSSGLTKLGRTPGGGAKAGLSNFIWDSALVAIAVSGGKLSPQTVSVS